MKLHRSPLPIPDKSRRIIGVGVPQPKGVSWADTNVKAAGAIEAARGKCTFPAKTSSEEHRRGPFPALATGVSYGGGQIVRHVGVTSSEGPQITLIMHRYRETYAIQMTTAQP